MLDTTKLLQIASNFNQELEFAKSGQNSSLVYQKIQLFLSVKNPQTTKIQVLMIGGSHLENTTAKIIDGSIKLGEVFKKKLQTIDSKQSFLQIIESEFKPQTELIAINLAFDCEPVFRNGSLDAKILAGSKEHLFKGFLNQNVGQNVEEFLFQKFGVKVQVIVANDLFCLGAGAKFLDLKTVDGLAFGVLGTGVNLGFWANFSTMINLESANFDKFEPSEACLNIDQISTNPGKHLLEKEIAGKYLPLHYQYWDAKNHHIPPRPLPQNSQEISTFAGSEHNFLTARHILGHSEHLFACQILGLYNFMKNLGLLKQKLTVIMEGSLFWQGYGYLKNVEECLQALGLTSDNLEFVFAADCGLKGAVELALTYSEGIIKLDN
jgi:hexokinase